MLLLSLLAQDRQRCEVTQWIVVQGQALVLELPLPVVDLAHAHAVFDDQFSHANAAALSFPESHWRQLEGPFLAGGPTSTALLC